MSLKNQLIAIGLLTLILPWFAWQYLTALDKNLRAAHASRVTEYAHVLVTLLKRDNLVLNELESRFNKQPALFAGELEADFQLDGYLNDWQQTNAKDYIFDRVPKDNSVIARLAYHDNELVLSMSIKGAKPLLYSPQTRQFDSVILTTDRGHRYRLVTAGAGVAHVQTWTGTFWRDELGSLAIWRPENDGSTLEWQLPTANLAGFALEYASAAWGHSVFLDAENRIGYVVRQQTGLLTTIDSLNNRENRLWLFDYHGYQIESLTHSQARYKSGPVEWPWRFWAYAWLVDQHSDPYVPLSTSIDPQTFTRQSRQGWLRNNGVPVVRVTLPIYPQTSHLPQTIFEEGVSAQSDKSAYNNLLPLGYLALEQSAVEFEATLLDHTWRFIGICFLISGLLVVILFLFATIHSWRIRRLLSFTRQSIADDGTVLQNKVLQNKVLQNKVAQDKTADSGRRHPIFPDELGELAWSFRELLTKLHRHQDYLKQLAMKLSHELRTPIAVVQSSLDNLVDTSSADAIYIQRARGGLEQLSNTLSAMSSANQLEASLDRAEFESIPIAHMLKELTQAYADAYSPTIIRSLIDIGSDIEAFCVPELIVQMLDKLVDNASQFAANGTEILISAKLVEPGYWQLSVENIGPPLPQTIRNSLFDAMVGDREQTPKNAVNGQNTLHLGLGLYIARLICQFHQGSISASDKPIDEKQARICFSARMPLHSDTARSLR